MNEKMDIKLNKEIAENMKGRFGADARRPPRCMEKAAAELMKELEEGGIVAKCEGPVNFLARAHFVMKADGVRVRLMTDYSNRLNPCIAREHHGFTCARDIRDGLDSNAKYYCVLDLPHAYFQIPLTPNASKLTTFIVNTGYGAHRYVYLRALMGLVSTSDFFNKETDLIFAGLPGVKKLVYDIYIEASSMEEMKVRVRKVLDQFGTSVKFGGFIVKLMYKMDLREVSNTRIHNFREKTAHCHFKVIWTPGKKHLITDTLSRAPAPGTFKDGEPSRNISTSGRLRMPSTTSPERTYFSKLQNNYRVDKRRYRLR